MAATPNDKAPAAPPVDAFVADWEGWHNGRLESLRAVDGAPTLAATYWLASTDVVPGVDGTWSDGDNGVELSLPEGAEVLVNGERTGGRVVALAAYEPLPGRSSVSYSYALESSPREVEVPGVVHFGLSGSGYAVTPFVDEGSLLLVFADRTTGTGSRPPSRFLLIEPPSRGLDQASPVVLDFNRAFLPPCAFSDEFNCPLPPSHHRLGAEVTVGETWAQLSPTNYDQC